MASSAPFICEGEIKAHTGLVNVLCYNSNGEYFFSAGADRKVKLWNAATRSLVQTYLSHGWEVLDVAVASDNSRFASCGGDKALFLWDVAGTIPVRRYAGHQQRINAVAFNEDATIVASGSYDSTVRVWDCKSRSRDPIQILCDAKDSITCLLVRDCCIVTGSVDGHVRIYDVRNGSLITDCVGPPVTSLSLSSDGNMMLVSSLDSCVRLFDSTSGKLLRLFLGHKNTTYKVHSCFDNGDARVFSGSETGGAVYTWDISESLLPSCKPVEPQQLLGGHKSSVLSVTTSPETRAVLTGGSDGTVRCWA